MVWWPSDRKRYRDLGLESAANVINCKVKGVKGTEAGVFLDAKHAPKVWRLISFANSPSRTEHVDEVHIDAAQHLVWNQSSMAPNPVFFMQMRSAIGQPIHLRSWGMPVLALPPSQLIFEVQVRLVGLDFNEALKLPPALSFVRSVVPILIAKVRLVARCLSFWTLDDKGLYSFIREHLWPVVGVAIHKLSDGTMWPRVSNQLDQFLFHTHVLLAPWIHSFHDFCNTLKLNRTKTGD